MWTRRMLASSLATLVATVAEAPQAQQGQPTPPDQMTMPMTGPVSGKRTPAPRDAYLYIIWPGQGTRVRGAFWCRFGLRNMGVTHAGDPYPNSGHHHLMVDVTEPLDPNEPIPTDKNHLHFGRGQTEARLNLPPGKHTLQLVLGDAKHRLFDPIVISQKITITVV